MDPLSSDTQPSNQGDSGVSIPVQPVTGTDGGVNQLPPPVTSIPTDDGGVVGPCEAQTIQTTPSIPDMLIVLDRSGSMNMSMTSPTDRWGGSRSAISQVTQDYDENIHFGLMTFPAWVPSGGGGDACNAGTLNVPVGVETGDDIATTLQAMNARGSTPTAVSLDVARTTLGPVITGPDIRSTAKYVLLVTDGDPNCSDSTMTGSGNQIDQAARDASIAAIRALATDGIKTYVVGFETAGTTFAGQLDAMAAAGDTGATSHRSVSSGADLADALKDVAAMVRSCAFALNKPVADALYVSVEVDGVRRALDREQDGWKLGTDMQTVTLTGAACASVKNGATLDIEVQCMPVPPVN